MSELTYEHPVSIELGSISVLSYAMAHNQVPFVYRLDLSNNGDDLRDVVVSLEVRDAEGRLSTPYDRRIDTLTSGTTQLSELDIKLDPAAMLRVEEQRPAALYATARAGGVVVGEARADIRVLAARQWLFLAQRPTLSMELLAASVMPNDPAITALMTDVAAQLNRSTGSPSIQGYQADERRVDQIVQAIFEVIQALRLAYSEPPASWADRGQKIRTPSEVVDGRVATCLDTVVLLAAALEQAGIRPLIWLVEGHAFLGYWRQERALDAIAQTDVVDVVNAIDLGQVELVETTMVTVSTESHRFAETHRPPYVTYLTGDLAKVLGVVDIWTARHNDVLPLPAQRRLVDGDIQVVEYRPAEHSTAPAVRSAAAQAGVAAETRTAAVPPRIQQWKNALLDLSLRNRLINFSDRASVSITVPDGQLGLMENLVYEKRGLQLLPADHLVDVQAARGVRTAADLPQERLLDALTRTKAVYTGQLSAGYQTRMRGLAYKARTIVEETGANNLYLALGSLVWEVDGKPLRSPLVLVPVKLVAPSKQLVYRLEVDESGTSTPNFCLLEKLHQTHGLSIPGLAEPVEDDRGIDLDAALHAVRIAIAEKGLRFRVESTADLSILQFAKFRLWKDLDEHWSVLMRNPLVRHLVEAPTDPFDDPSPTPTAARDLDELDALCPVPADASQLEAVADAIAGRTFVLEGPPGTGKSQTITNLLTRALAEGKRVLFVAEKRAALDVVRQRLEAVGVGPFSLDLHDKGSRPAVVRAQIKAALDHAVQVDEQGLAAQRESLQSSRRSLARYATRLHEANGAGQSYYAARTSQLALGEGPSLPIPRELLNGTATAALETLRQRLRELPDVADPARPAPDHPWRFAAATDISGVDVEQVRALVDAVDTALAGVPATGALGSVLQAVRTPEDLKVLDSLLDGPAVPLTVLDATRTESWQRASESLAAEITAFVAVAQPGLDVATPDAIDLPLADIHAWAQAAAASNWFVRKKRLRAVVEQLSPGLRPGAKVDLKRLVELTGALLQVQTTIRGISERGRSVTGVHIPEAWNPLTPEGRALVERQVGWLAWAGSAVAATDTGGPTSDHVGFSPALRRFLDGGSAADQAAAAAVQRLSAALQALAEWSGSPTATWSAWAGDIGLLERWVRTAGGRDTADPGLLSLRRWTAFLAWLEPIRVAGLSAAYGALLEGSVHAEDAVRAFDRGLAAASLHERRLATGLDSFDPVAHDRAVSRFASSMTATRAHLRSEVPRHILDSRPFDAATGRGRVGALQRELAKQRRGLGVRALLGTYGELITQVMPCVLVSPDSVARFFPVGGDLFDIVVFDEASQIRVADAVGAMGRSRSVVVVGDSKQMPPTSFAEPSAGTDDEPEDEPLVVEDEESILSECVLARVHRRWLSWHYRSKDEALIAFSNHYYYDGRLSSFPAPTSGGEAIDADAPGVRLVRVNGTFQRAGKGKLLRTNPVEAEAVVAEIRRRFAASPSRTPSIGVVTFNLQQRAHIEGLLRDTADERLVEALDGTEEEGLFIKNLENVQGDERDVILFSTAFSVNEKGLLPLNFGPLNRGGGERRLNVAVTRARRQILVFSSFEPKQLRAEETSSVGIKHLRAYLDLAAEGASILQRARTASLPDRHREEVADALRSRGLAVETEVGLSDFKIDLSVATAAAPGRPVMAVLMDGPGWRDRRTVGDRDGLPVQVLSKLLDWPAVERVWMPDWLANRDAVVDRLVAGVAAANTRVETERSAKIVATAEVSVVERVSALSDTGGTDDSLRTDGRSAATIGAPVALATDLSGASAFRRRPDVEPPVPAQGAPVDAAPRVATEPATVRLPNESDFVPWTPARMGGRNLLDELPGQRAGTQVRRALIAGIAAEGPIHLDRLARSVAGAFDLTRVSSARSEAILAQLPRGVVRDRHDRFAWPPELDPATWVGFRRASQSEPRVVDHVARREVANAMVALCSASAGMFEEELLRDTLAIFGGKRLTPGISSRLRVALESALSGGRLVLGADGLYVAG